MLPLPLTLADALKLVVNPALALLPSPMTSDAAKVELLAIGLQESQFAARVQADNGPAHGFWQFERGGVRGVLKHPTTERLAVEFCRARTVAPIELAVYEALADDDILAAGFARLLLWSDPKPLPGVGMEDDAWRLYARLWRPGKPRPETWHRNYWAALTCVCPPPEDAA